MKLAKPLVVLMCIVFFASFINDELYNPSMYEARIMFREDLENSIKLNDSVILTNSGKLYFKDNFIFVTKRYEGIHVINNYDPSNPKNVAFIEIPGCQDLAIKKNILYADNSTDLVAIDISKLPDSISVVNRLKKAFPNPLPPDMEEIPEPFRAYNRPKNTVIVGWKEK